IFDRAGAIFVNIPAESNRVRHIAPKGLAGFFKFANQKSFLRPMWKEHVNRLEMRAGHRENMGRALDQIGGERLASQITDVYAVSLANLDCVKTRRLTPNRVHAGRSDLDIFTVADQAAKQSF